MKTQLIFIGECRSLTAIRKGWSWKDGRLAAKPLFEALRAMDVDPQEHLYYNLFNDPPARRNARRWVPKVNDGIVTGLLVQVKGRVVVALGAKVSVELARRSIKHVALVHPAARGKIRKRERYHAHVKAKLTTVIKGQLS